jgi:hypothetical protein
VRHTTWIFALALPLAAQRHYNDRDWRIDQRDTIRKTFNLGADGRKLLVDNISGYIHVTGHSGSSVQVNVEQHILADSNTAAADAKRDVKLDMDQQGNFVRLYVDGPFRNGNGINYRGDDYYGYRVIYDFEIEVPADTELIVKGLNHGDIVVKKTSGDYDIHGLNGGIEMDDVGGSGSVHTLNGNVKITYTRNPSKSTSYHTLNGSIDVYFHNAPDADMHFKRLNGAVYTDFDLTMIPEKGSSSTGDGRWIYRSDRTISGRAGRGGPEFSFDTLNGSIRLHSKTF